MKRKKNKTAETDRSVEEILSGQARFWRFSDLLRKVYRGAQPLASRLTERLTEYDDCEDRERTARKVRNWMHDRNLPKSREELFKICFALDLDEERTEQVLGITSESGIHYRNPRELIYAFCLRKGIDYSQAVIMVENLWENTLSKKQADNQSSESSPSHANLTGSVRQRFHMVTTEDELREFLKSSAHKFGRYHNTAYRKFRKMLDCLVQPESVDGVLPEDQNYSIRKAVDQYLRMGIPYERKSAHYSEIQREIKHHWPSAKSIYEMCSQKIDIDRKTLLLLYIATEGESELSPDDQRNTEEHQRRMDLMLAECGMPVLNILCPFDYLVIRAVSGENEDDFIGSRMERMVRKIFSRDKTAGYLTSEE